MSTVVKTGSSTAGEANVDSNYNLQTVTPGYNATGTSHGGGPANGQAMFSEKDPGTVTGSRYVLSPEVDDDYRMRVATDLELDDETFNYTAQNTGKHNNQSTTMTYSYGTGGLLTNASSITTTTTGLSTSTYAMFPVFSSGIGLYCQLEASFSIQPVANTIIDFGMFMRPTSNPYAPTDGAYFRLTSSGLAGVINHNGTETATSIFTFTYTNSKVYSFTIAISNEATEFWIDNVLYGEIPTPTSQAQPFMSAALPVSFRHVITGGAAGGVMQFTLRGYGVSIGGLNVIKNLGELGSAIYGSYQGLSGGTMGQLVSGTVTTGTLVKPTAAVPSNTALTANLANSLGGRSWETYTSPLATNTDGIIAQYQVPAGTVSVMGKRLKIRGIHMSGVISTVITGGPFTQEWYLVFGNTATSLQTAESATAKAPRRVMLPGFTQNITATQAVQTAIQQPTTYIAFDEPIYVNPGEFLSLVNNWFGTAPTAGVAAYTYQFVYSWE